MEPYKEKFTVGSKVRVAVLSVLREFQRTWEFHNKLHAEQLGYAGRVTEVAKVGFYHGGDVLYELAGVPGIWHEQCLGPADDERRPITPQEIEEHNHAFQEGSELVEGELLLQGLQFPSMDQSVQARLRRGLELFARVLEINPLNWSAMWLVGKVHQRLGDQAMAYTWFARAHQVNPCQTDVAREASISAMSLGRSEDAIAYACSALKDRPSDTGLQANVALALLLAGRLDEARTAIRKALANDPADKASQTVLDMIDHFLTCGERPPSTTAALEDYWKRHKSA